MTWKHMCCLMKSRPISQNTQMFLRCRSTALFCSTDLQKHLFIHSKCHDIESGWFIWHVPWGKEQKKYIKLEISGRIAAFLDTLDTQEKANIPSCPRADWGELSEGTALWSPPKDWAVTHIPQEVTKAPGLLHSGFSPSRNNLSCCKPFPWPSLATSYPTIAFYFLLHSMT